jgi:hypothetical protein
VFQATILTAVEELKESNRELKLLLQNVLTQERDSFVKNSEQLEALPLFPLQSEGELEECEAKLKSKSVYDRVVSNVDTIIRLIDILLYKQIIMTVLLLSGFTIWKNRWRYHCEKRIQPDAV